MFHYFRLVFTLLTKTLRQNLRTKKNKGRCITHGNDIQFGAADVNRTDWRTGETPSGGMQASARGLARIASLMANQGSIGGKQVIGKKTVEELHSEPVVEYEALTDKRTIYTKGGVHYYSSELLDK